jgi:hypothetical protein
VFKIPIPSIIGATTDGGANMVAGVRILLDGNDRNITCFLHYLHNMVMRLIKLNVAIDLVLKQVMAFASYLRMSLLTMDAFRYYWH